MYVENEVGTPSFFVCCLDFYYAVAVANPGVEAFDAGGNDGAAKSVEVSHEAFVFFL